jgi:hypothetical protein
MFIFPFILAKHFFMFQVQFLFVIKLGNILTLGNTFVVCRVHTLFLHCITLLFTYSPPTLVNLIYDNPMVVF